MSPARLPLTYRSFIDDMVEAARGSVRVERIRTAGHAERAETRDVPLDAEHSARKVWAQSLTREQREFLADLLLDERVGAVHDVLAYLEWAVSCGHLRMTGTEGESLADASPESMHGDFMSRVQGYAW